MLLLLHAAMAGSARMAYTPPYSVTCEYNSTGAINISTSAANLDMHRVVLHAAIAGSARMAFTPPCSVTCEYEMGPQLRCQSELLLVPRGPGRSMAINMIQMTNTPSVTAGSVLQALLSKPAQVPGLLKR
jgi:hypothetical protein